MKIKLNKKHKKIKYQVFEIKKQTNKIQYN